jgi:hypothetical protein
MWKSQQEDNQYIQHRTKTDSCTWNITRGTDSIAVWNLKSEQWGSPLVQEKKYQEEKVCEKRYRSTTTTSSSSSSSDVKHLIRCWQKTDAL